MVTIENGNKILTLSISGESEWKNGDQARTYFEVPNSEKRCAVHKLYRIDSGTTRDKTMTVNGKVYGYELGVHCDSYKKREAAVEGIRKLLETL